LPKFDNPDFLNREQHFSDAGIYRISATQALVQTVDFFTPIVDDPYTFGQIAAANSLSDVYAMGGKPLTALNIICFPVSCQPLEVMEAILHGGYDKVIEAGAVVVGGHSIEDPEPKYGLSVTGLVEIDQLITSHGAKPGDILVLTKPLGTGIIATALKGGMIAEKDAVEAVRGMSQLNAAASETMSEVGVTACTDVTGFSLLGHLREMLITSAVSAEIDYQKVPLYPAVTEMMAMGMIPAGAYRNLEYIRPHVDWQGSPEAKEDALIIMADPQTSGGLLVALSPEKVDPYLALLNEKGTAGHPIGQISADQAGRIVIR
jgi:selenide, water dikinase